ncbi:MAG: bifunctional oligoribonuclease/PAP phosphatase NrnA, partial [Clostridiales bacterium]|nr:bifunctional oligoribonuclease/PAP phosphatase NrnA [Clostridiales bacterium]
MTKKAIEILNAIKAADSILICGHIRPDGDCVGSALAMYGICKKLGKNVDVACADGVSPATYAFLPNFDKLNALKEDKYDLFIAVDCANESRLGDMFKFVSSSKYSIKIDHHPSENNYCKYNYVDSSACSTCAIIFELFEDSGLIDCDIAKALYTGLSTDTGHFMHSNTTPKVFGIAKKLSEYGFDVGAVNHDIYCSKTFNR